MSQSVERWEREVRSTVTKHEFDFDPQAWKAMDKLMDQAGVATGRQAPPDPSASLWGTIGKISLGIFIGAALITILLWWNRSDDVSSSSLTTTTLREEGKKPVIIEEKGLVVENKPDFSPIQKTDEIDDLGIELLQVENTTGKEKLVVEEEEYPFRVTRIISLLPPPALLPVKSERNHSRLKNVQPTPIEIQNGRPTLFPDVKDKY